MKSHDLPGHASTASQHATSRRTVSSGSLMVVVEEKSGRGGEAGGYPVIFAHSQRTHLLMAVMCGIEGEKWVGCSVSGRVR